MIPTPTNENWKYTRLDSFQALIISHHAMPSLQASLPMEPFGHHLIFMNGHCLHQDMGSSENIKLPHDTEFDALNAKHTEKEITLPSRDNRHTDYLLFVECVNLDHVLFLSPGRDQRKYAKHLAGLSCCA